MQYSDTKCLDQKLRGSSRGSATAIQVISPSVVLE
jgi:hypothetical protein